MKRYSCGVHSARNFAETERHQRYFPEDLKKMFALHCQDVGSP